MRRTALGACAALALAMGTAPMRPAAAGATVAEVSSGAGPSAVAASPASSATNGGESVASSPTVLSPAADAPAGDDLTATSPAGPTIAALRAATPRSPTSTVTIVHGLPGAAYDVYVNGLELLADFEPATKAVVLLPAATYQVMLVPAGAAPLAANAVIDQSVTVPGGDDISLVADLSATGTPQLATFVDDTRVLPAGDARLAVYNAADTGPIDLYVNGSKVAASLANGTDAELTLPAGTYTLQVNDAGTSTALIATRSVSLTAGSLSEVFAVGALSASFSPLQFILVPKPLGAGYQLVASDGGVFSFGNAGFFGSTGGEPLNRPIVGMASVPLSPGVDSAAGQGYWLVASDGGVFSFGDAGFFGSTGSLHLNAPIVGMAATPDGQGYWLVASDGGIFTFGDATFYGSMGGTRLAQPIVGMAATADGRGYWLVGADGGIFTFGDATFLGSLAGSSMGAPVVGLAPTPDGNGYWLAAANGAVASFGDADQLSPATGLHPAKPVVAIVASPTGLGYTLAAADGGVFTFGDSAFYGSMGGHPLNAAVVGAAL